jgi:hypothetical protein
LSGSTTIASIFVWATAARFGISHRHGYVAAARGILAASAEALAARYPTRDGRRINLGGYDPGFCHLILGRTCEHSLHSPLQKSIEGCVHFYDDICEFFCSRSSSLIRPAKWSVRLPTSARDNRHPIIGQQIAEILGEKYFYNEALRHAIGSNIPKHFLISQHQNPL